VFLRDYGAFKHLNPRFFAFLDLDRNFNRIAGNGGREPRWSPDGREIHCREPAFRNSPVAASFQPGRRSVVEIGLPEKLSQFRATLILPQENSFLCSPAARGRFPVNASTETGEPTINLIGNWQRLPGGAEGQ
jgi:hypothetical protein